MGMVLYCTPSGVFEWASVQPPGDPPDYHWENTGEQDPENPLIYKWERYDCVYVPEEGDIIGTICDQGLSYNQVATGTGDYTLERNPDGDGQCAPSYKCENGLAYQSWPEDPLYWERAPAEDWRCQSGSGSAGSGSGSPGSGSPGSGSGSDHGSGSGSEGSASGSRSSGSGSGSGSGSPSGSGSASGSPSGSPSSGSGSPSNSSSSKNAIVAAADEWIGWSCAEADNVFFEIVRTVAFARSVWVQQGSVFIGIVRLQIEPEMLESCEPGSIFALEVMPVGAGAAITAAVHEGLAVITAEVPRKLRRPIAAHLRLRGIRKGHDNAWRRFTPDQARSNDIFYSIATPLPNP